LQEEIMSIQLGEQLIPLSSVPNLPWLPPRRGGKKLGYTTVWHWVKYGIQGHKLEVLRLGGQPVTTEKALLAFFKAVTESRLGA
jgi:hypothetical protein